MRQFSHDAFIPVGVWIASTAMMKVSFVIPAYNEEAYIGDCLTSIITSTAGAPFCKEIIVVDNNSTDRTAQIAKSFPGVQLVNAKEQGLVHSRNAGFMASTGELIANIDADTRITHQWVLNMITEFANEKLVVLSGPLVYYDLDKKRLAIVRLFYYASSALSWLSATRFPRVQGGNFIARRSALEKIGGFNTQIDFYGEDTDIARRMVAVGEVKFSYQLSAPSSGRRLHHEGVIMTGWRYMINYFWILFLKRPFHTSHKDVGHKSLC